MTRPFAFKQFVVSQERSAMKVGTDGVMLGAWCSVDNASHILDVGTGTGIISLMIAQRNSHAQIVALEPDAEAAREAAGNFRLSPWNERLSVQQTTLQDYLPKAEILFDRIICNPPFHSADVRSSGNSRDLARHASHLPPSAVFAAADRLSPSGRIALILPCNETTLWIREAVLKSLFLVRQCEVTGAAGKPPVRKMLEFSLLSEQATKENLLIRDENGELTKEYRELTDAFYL